MIREDTVDRWNLALEDALEFRREYGREIEWARVEALFYQAHQSQENNVGPNIIASTGDALLSSLCVPKPQYILKALRRDSIESTPVLETQLNVLLYALGIKNSFETAALHTYLYGRGILKVGYDSEFGYCPQYDLGMSMDKGKMVFGLSTTQFDKKGSRIEFNSKITPGMPWVEPVMPHDFVVPWGTGPRLTKSPWCAQRIIRHIDDIKADPKYENKKDLQPTMSMTDWVKSYLTVMKPYRAGTAFTSKTAAGNSDWSDECEYVEMWEIHDTRTNRIMVIAQGHDKFLRSDIDYLQTGSGLPYVSMSFVPTSRTFWTTPDSVYLRATQNEVIDIAKIQKHQRRISLMRFLYGENAIEADELDRFFSGELGVGVKIKEGVKLDEAVMAMTPVNSNNQLQNEAEAARDDARETVGIGTNQMGEYSGGRKTAAEAQIVQGNSNQRLNRRQLALADCYCELGQQLTGVMRTFWKTPRLVQIIGNDGAAVWTAFTGDHLTGEYQFQIGFSSEPVGDKGARKQEAIQIFQFLANDPTIDQLSLRRYLCRAFNDPEFTTLFKSGIVENANLSLLMSQLSLLNPPQAGGGQANLGGMVPQNGVGGASPPARPTGNTLPGVQQGGGQRLQQPANPLQSMG